MNETITEKLFSTAVSLDSEKAELLETAGIEIERLTAENSALKTRLSGRTYYHDNESVEKENADLRAELEKVEKELADYKNRYADLAGEFDCRSLDLGRWVERAEQAERALNIANTDKEMALKELAEIREYLAIEVGPEMWHMDEVDKAILAERTRCAEIAKKNTDLSNVQQDGSAFIAYGNGFVNLQESDNYAFDDTYEGAIIAFVQKEISAAIMEEPE